jgi:7-carboxy-7-deazaguanine synthase
MSTLIINEIFYSIQGESSRSGLPTHFVRLTGCPLRCSYCDTEYAFKSGTKMTFNEIISQLNINMTKFVTITGGEPLAQKSALDFMRKIM